MSSPSTAGLDRRILALAVPALGALVAEPLFVLIDSAMVGHLGAADLAGLSLASSVLTTVVGLFVFLAYATTATTARLFGAGDRRGGLRAGVEGLWLAALLGAGAALVLGAAAPGVVGALGADGAVARAAVAYLRASAPGLPGMLVVFAATGTLRGLLDTRTPFVVATAGAALNVGLNALLLYGVRMGIAGSGLGTALAQSAMAVALAAPVLRSAREADVGLAPSRTGLRASLGSGAPLLVRTVSLRAAILTTVWAATALGAVPLAAHQVVNSLWSFAAFALDALAVAAQALVGTALGQADAAGERAGDAGGAAAGADGARAAPSGPAPHPSALGVDAILRRTLGWGAATGAVIGVVLAAASPWLPWLFTSEAAVASAARPALLVAASAMPLAGAVFLFDGILMGAGDGRYLAGAGLVTLVPYVPLAVAVAHGLPAASPADGLAWLWAAFAWVFMGARGLTTGLRARTTAWRR
ncbi:MATE family efflux transporter [Actinomyces sp. oral taxon 414]|uniref:MATE family efflux transporter n=1 Tax=Actinomyces sp. oral taxon 414 TaxID=712122 RepID=UPI00209CB65A|nr:MATE family efflux transporter [Actinomyces sp. oral taxon 414]